jgi:hypothetical protein
LECEYFDGEDADDGLGEEFPDDALTLNDFLSNDRDPGVP